MVLNHLGYKIDKCILADDFLNKGEIGSTDFSEAFVGNPRDDEGYGCYANVIQECAQDYLTSIDAKVQVLNLTSTDFKTDNIVYVSDPLQGSVKYDMDLFIKRYHQLSSQAIVII